ncbi:MAG TPA: hypothetical protein VFQ91_15390, partial [Bryobacteraceae bacterium]|nr:hypothetical protein [Bryobacteraceae bacterium]
PIGGDSIEKIFNKILYEPLDLTPLQAAGVDPEVQRIVAKCTAKQPQDRYQKLFDTAVDIERFLGVQTTARMVTTTMPTIGTLQQQGHGGSPTSQTPASATSRPPAQTGYTQQATQPQTAQRPVSNPAMGQTAGQQAQTGWNPAQQTAQTGVRPNQGYTGAQQVPDGLPGFVKILPASLQNQTGVMILVALAVLLFMAAIYFVISLVS